MEKSRSAPPWLRSHQQWPASTAGDQLEFKQPGPVLAGHEEMAGRWVERDSVQDSFAIGPLVDRPESTQVQVT